MNDREKLIELLKKTEITRINGHRALAEVCFTPHVFENMADHLLAHGVTVQRWIPASDPPKEDGEYIVCFEWNDFGKRGRTVGRCDFDTEVGFYELVEQIDDTYRKDPRDDVTYWMPLPEPPKEDDYGIR